LRSAHPSGSVCFTAVWYKTALTLLFSRAEFGALEVIETASAASSWADADDLVKCVKALGYLLSRVPLTRVVTNGHIEKELRFFLAGALEGAINLGGHCEGLDRPTALPTRHYLCVMDKQFGAQRSRAEPKGKRSPALDLLALDRGSRLPAFWIETKCHFREERVNVPQLTDSVWSQVWRYVDKLRQPEWAKDKKSSKLCDKKPTEGDDKRNDEAFRKELLNCPVYIVHFLNPLPDRLPPAIQARFPTRAETGGLNSQLLLQHYTQDGHDCDWRALEECIKQRDAATAKARRDKEKLLRGAEASMMKASYKGRLRRVICDVDIPSGNDSYHIDGVVLRLDPPHPTFGEQP